MKYFIDTEFHNYEKRTGFFNQKRIRTIDLISIAIVSETGKKYYKVSKDFDLKAAWANKWIRENVLKPVWENLYFNEPFFTRQKFPQLINFSYEGLKNLISWHGETKDNIAKDLKKFLIEDIINGEVEIYGYFCDFDYVVFSQLFGDMNHYPPFLPYYFMDIRQTMQEKYKKHLKDNDTGLDLDYDSWKRKHFSYYDNIHDCYREVHFIKEYYDKLEKMNATEKTISTEYGYFIETNKGEIFVLAENIAQAFDKINETGNYEKHSLIKSASIPIII